MTKHVLIIGGSAGMGLASARLLLSKDYRVTIAGRDARRLEAAKAGLEGPVAALAMDAADIQALPEAFRRCGPIDHLVLALGSNKGGGMFAETSLEQVRQGVEEKVYPHFACAQAALPHLAKNGSITFLSAVSAQAALRGTAGLAAANAAVAALAPVLASELRPLRVNAVSPGVVDTRWWDFLPAEARAALFAGFVAATPVGRVGKAEDIADAVAFLIGNSFMTGQVLICDGGIRLGA
ncbi:SDR family oxidoreductase [Chromobacterium alticapitis]|uniref:Short-chain dehydrogenase n=1 Tax=Chromobacterium alticapitis TaxID=2073169 RepID=A0A2S5DIP8_9NEIS|nr:SDR family oxidoreductase [Chromobacterium alticapitis]POZ62907.1 short-chain dehydrogenase [Chromobacterium alticapitis]